MTPEHKTHLSTMLKGRIPHNKGQKGYYKATEETKAKMRLSHKSRKIKNV